MEGILSRGIVPGNSLLTATLVSGGSDPRTELATIGARSPDARREQS